jgi:hypothetical protein
MVMAVDWFIGLAPPLVADTITVYVPGGVPEIAPVGLHPDSADPATRIDSRLSSRRLNLP